MGWLDVLGWVGSALLIYSLMQARVLRFRLLNLVACVVQAGYSKGPRFDPTITAMGPAV